MVLKKKNDARRIKTKLRPSYKKQVMQVLFLFYPKLFFLACDVRRYGQGCNNVCGKCLNQSVCNHIDGNCLYGCDPGFQGVLCKLGKCDLHLLF